MSELIQIVFRQRIVILGLVVHFASAAIFNIIAVRFLSIQADTKLVGAYATVVALLPFVALGDRSYSTVAMRMSTVGGCGRSRRLLNFLRITNVKHARTLALATLLPLAFTSTIMYNNSLRGVTYFSILSVSTALAFVLTQLASRHSAVYYGVGKLFLCRVPQYSFYFLFLLFFLISSQSYDHPTEYQIGMVAAVAFIIHAVICFYQIAALNNLLQQESNQVVSRGPSSNKVNGRWSEYLSNNFTLMITNRATNNILLPVLFFIYGGATVAEWEYSSRLFYLVGSGASLVQYFCMHYIINLNNDGVRANELSKLMYATSLLGFILAVVSMLGVDNFVALWIGPDVIVASAIKVLMGTYVFSVFFAIVPLGVTMKEGGRLLHILRQYEVGLMFVLVALALLCYFLELSFVFMISIMVCVPVVTSIIISTVLMMLFVKGAIRC